MKDVWISITGSQYHLDEPMRPDENNTVQLVTGGSYQHSDTESWFRYQESSLTGMEGTTTTFHVENGMVTLTREGSVNAQMLFQKGQRHCFLYDTPYGAMTMGIQTQHLKTNLDEHGGSMNITYTVDMNHVPVGRNVFRIAVKEATEQEKGESNA